MSRLLKIIPTLPFITNRKVHPLIIGNVTGPDPNPEKNANSAYQYLLRPIYIPCRWNCRSDAGPMAVPGLSISGNPTYNLGYTDYSNKVPLSYYNNKIDIHSDHGVSPIR
jgi:hypothetical protein